MCIIHKKYVHAIHVLEAKEIATKVKRGICLYACIKKAAYLICVKEIPIFFLGRILSMKHPFCTQILQCLVSFKILHSKEKQELCGSLHYSKDTHIK